ncbi:MAG: hypothetical protein R2708_17390 [Vicinamibacterales bacterium]
MTRSLSLLALAVALITSGALPGVAAGQPVAVLDFEAFKTRVQPLFTARREA